MDISLFYVARPTTGGWVTYTSQLIESFKKMGVTPNLYKIANRDENRLRPFHNGTKYRNVTKETAKQIAITTPSILVALDWKLYDIGLNLSNYVKAWVIHDSNEVTNEFKEAVKGKRVQIITIRKSISTWCDRFGIPSTYIMHPYISQNVVEDRQPKDWHAVSTSRVDFDKYTHIIVEANTLLPKEKRVRIYGHENRIYMYCYHRSKFPNWKDDYYGRFVHPAQRELISRSDFVVDLTEIKNDGGGTQYTFLEAFDFGSTLILNKAWLNNPDFKDRIEDGVNCLAISTPQELADILKRDDIQHNEIRNNARMLLSAHAPENVVPKYLELL